MSGDKGNKRSGDDRDRPGNKKSKGNGWRKGGYSITGIEPGFQGVFATCDRTREGKAIGELTEHFEEIANDLYHLDDEEAAAESEEEEVADIAAAMAKEMDSLKTKKSQKDRKILPVKLDSQCVVFFRFKHPLDPTEMVKKICEAAVAPNFRNTRTVSRLTPIVRTGKATMEGIKEVAQYVLAPHFHQGQKGLKFAIRVTSRNHNVLGRMDIINEVARTVGPEHSVDLKNYDVLILIELYKNICGMGVVRDFEKYRRFNLRELQASGILDENAEEQKKAVKVEEPVAEKSTKAEEPAAEKGIKAEELKVEAPVVQSEATEDAKPEEKPETAVEA